MLDRLDQHPGVPAIGPRLQLLDRAGGRAEPADDHRVLLLVGDVIGLRHRRDGRHDRFRRDGDRRHAGLASPASPPAPDASPPPVSPAPAPPPPPSPRADGRRATTATTATSDSSSDSCGSQQQNNQVPGQGEIF